MYQMNDTIVAVGSPAPESRVIVRISGPETINAMNRILSPPIQRNRGGIFSGSVIIDDELKIGAKVYLFAAPHSYSGEDVAEIHVWTNSSVTEVLMNRLLGMGLRLAGPGEFTARAYLNGKIDLAQAEAVNEIITSSNKFQLAAAEKLLAGRLNETAEKIRSSLLDCLSRIEAGLDFSGEDIEFISRTEAIGKISAVKEELESLLAGSITCEKVADLPAVGIAGAPGVGKSSLLNKLLGRERSIVSDRHGTTRDVLTGVLTLKHCECVLFDCAGLMVRPCSPLVAWPQTILDELAQQAAVEALRNTMVVVFCADISKTDWMRDVEIRRLIEPECLIAVATKSDLADEDESAKRLSALNELFGVEFISTSAKTGAGIELLKKVIDGRIIASTVGKAAGEPQAARQEIALTARHRQAVTEAIELVRQAVEELKIDNDEIAAMLLRAACQAISDIERQNMDEQLLENIFKHFCIGK